MKASIRLVGILSVLSVTAAFATDWTASLLNDLAVKDTNGNIIVLGTTGSYNNGGNTKEKIYDGNVGTFFDPAGPGVAWAGFELETPKMITRVAYYGRSGFAYRMWGCLFQGANSADFSDAVTLHVANPPSGWNGLSWVDVSFSGTNCFQSFKYVRILGPSNTESAGGYCGNAAEVHFYGAPFPTDTTAPSAPVLSRTCVINGRFNFQLTPDASALGYQVQAKSSFDADWVDVGGAYFALGSTLQHSVSGYVVYAPTKFRVRAVNAVGASDWAETGTFAAQPFVTGAWFGQKGAYNGGTMTGDKAFDGNVFTYYDSTNGVTTGWTALDFGKPCTITGFHWIARQGWGTRMNGGRFQMSETGFFDEDAQTFYTVSGTQSDTDITAVTLDAPVTARYVRYISPDGGCGNVAEIEFDTADMESEPASLTATFGDLTNATVVVAWSPMGGALQNVSNFVWRATAPGGPFICVTPAGLAHDTFGWEDSSAIPGVLYYYKVCGSGIGADGASVTGRLSSATASFRPGVRLERAWSDLTQVKSGVSVICDGSSWNGNANTVASKLFDGNINTYADIASGNNRIGVDFVTACHVAFIRAYPRSGQIPRLNGVVLYGSNNSSDWATGATAVTVPINSTSMAWSSAAAKDAGAYRYVFLYNGTWYCNAAELEIYGWQSGTAADSVLLAPTGITLTPATGKLTVSWTAGANAASYRVERKTGNGDWAVLGESVSGTTFEDSTVAYNGTRYTYRVASVRVDELAYSEDVSSIPYVHGAGTGLWAKYRNVYTLGYNVDEAVALVTTNAAINFSWGTGALPSGASDYVGAIWNGKLIVPYDGAYKFIATVDDGMALRIDGQLVLNRWYYDAMPMTNRIVLTAGEHDIHIDYIEATSGANAILKWSGCVDEEVIPSSQFVPVPFDETLPSPWEGERTFNETYKGTVAFGGDGSVTLTGGCVDFFTTNEGHEFLWKEVTGDFDFSAKITRHAALANTGARALLLVKNSLTSGQPVLAPSVLCNNAASGGIRFDCKVRETAGGAIVDFSKVATDWGETETFWMRLRRRGDLFYGESRLSDTNKWQTAFIYTNSAAAFNDTLYIGPAVTAASGAVPPTFTFSNIILGPASDGTVLHLR
jgi:hypothetical protein